MSRSSNTNWVSAPKWGFLWPSVIPALWNSMFTCNSRSMEYNFYCSPPQTPGASTLPCSHDPQYTSIIRNKIKLFLFFLKKAFSVKDIDSFVRERKEGH